MSVVEMRCLVVGWSLALCLPGAVASAQWDASAEPPTSEASVAAEPPPPPPQLVGTPPPPPQQQPAKKGIEKLFQWGLSLGVPVFLNVDRAVVRPGASLLFFGGLDIKYAVFAIDAGLQWNPIDIAKSGIPEAAGFSRSPLTRIFFGPEIRIQVPNKSLALPYVTGAFDVNWWNYRETGFSCVNFWYCGTTSVFRFTPGFTGKVGVGLEVNDGLHIDVGFKYAMTGKGDFFLRTEWWLEGYVGIIMRRKSR